MLTLAASIRVIRTNHRLHIHIPSRVVRKRYPEAKSMYLFLVDARLNLSHVAEERPNQVSNLRIVYEVQNNATARSLQS
jgi:hypothetical protein